MPEDNDASSDFLLKVLETLKSVPLWLLLGLALTAWVTLYALSLFPAWLGLDLAAFRQTWGTWILVGAVASSILTVTRFVAMTAEAILSYRRGRAELRILRLVPLQEDGWWHLAQQQDGTSITQIKLPFQVSNTTDEPVQIAKCRLTRSRAKVLNLLISLPVPGSSYHSFSQPVPPHGTAKGILTLIAEGALAKKGCPIKISLAIIDQYGGEYTLKNLAIKSTDSRSPVPDLSEQLCSLGNRALVGLHLKPRPQPVPLLEMPWKFTDGAAYLDVARVILREEKRNYAARGRQHGKLGSLNVGLQSEPNHGWTKVGEVPELLWPKESAQTVTSDNLQRLLDLRESLPKRSRPNLDLFLLSQLHKDSVSVRRHLESYESVVIPWR
jgi:hypothetical protein